MMLRLDQQIENSWDTLMIGASKTSKTPVIGSQFIVTSTAGEAMMIEHFSSQ
ncbi:hypothetical protein N9M78_03280 [Alphaproteobacteria bacterium]|nr:hypothetical protein [Alphaproteobacteria bacterium]